MTRKIGSVLFPACRGEGRGDRVGGASDKACGRVTFGISVRVSISVSGTL